MTDPDNREDLTLTLTLVGIFLALLLFTPNPKPAACSHADGFTHRVSDLHAPCPEYIP